MIWSSCVKDRVAVVTETRKIYVYVCSVFACVFLIPGRKQMHTLLLSHFCSLSTQGMFGVVEKTFKRSINQRFISRI